MCCCCVVEPIYNIPVNFMEDDWDSIVQVGTYRRSWRACIFFCKPSSPFLCARAVRLYLLQFEIHSADAEGYEDYSVVQTVGEHEGAERSVIRRDFVLNDELYSGFNT